MPPLYIARIEGIDRKFEEYSQAELEIKVAQEVANWNGVIEKTVILSRLSLLCAFLLIIITALIYWPSVIVVLALIVVYDATIDHEYNHFAHLRSARRHKKAWEIELARIQNLDSRIPYKNPPA